MPRHDMENIHVIRKAVKLYEANRQCCQPQESKKQQMELKKTAENSKIKHYFNKISRERIWRKISAELDIPVPVVKKKLTSLLGGYRREKSRENKSKLRSGTGKVYKSKWFAYPWFTFLTNKNITDNTADSIVCDDTTNADENNEDSSNIESQNTTTETNSENNENSFQDTTNEIDSLNTSNLKDVAPDSSKSKNVMVAPWAKSKVRKRRLNATPNKSHEDHFTSFGNHVANELRKYDEHVLPHVKKAILDIIFQADTGQFPVAHGYTYTSGYHTSSPSTDPIESPHLQREESTDSTTLQQNMDSDTEEQKGSFLE